MKRAFVFGLAIIAVATFIPAPARADDASATMRVLTLEQAVDCITTIAVLRSGGFERDPLAVPFTRSALTEIGAAAALNIVARRFVPVHILRTVVNVYPVILLGNVHAMTTSGSEAGIIGGGPFGFAPGLHHHHPPR
ncbi:MAG: hypothetical protein JO043_13330 [Candidatus Eremiobacteraeota bacterium]|nr:hypothetical protein [Candidatus Eremiobacteraeota bacterium]